MKYKTLAELKTAFDSGEIPKNWEGIILDNDSTSMYEEVIDGNGDVDYGEKIFDGGMPSELLEEALTLLGIPWGNA